MSGQLFYTFLIKQQPGDWGDIVFFRIYSVRSATARQTITYLAVVEFLGYFYL
jgi:hypothetical protein